MAIVILATTPQMIAGLYTVPRAASMGPALGLAGMPGRESSCCSHRTAASVEHECAVRPRRVLGMLDKLET